jgi:hypothetical protein
MEKLQVGIDIGGTKMLLLAKTAGGNESRKIATGSNFSAVDAEKANSRASLRNYQPHRVPLASRFLDWSIRRLEKLSTVMYYQS